MTGKKRPRRRDAGRPRGAPVARAVLRETLEELATAGLEGLSVERIARRAEVNKTSVYRRWPTREALVAAALDGVREELSENLPDTGSLRGDLLALVGMVAELVQQPAGKGLLRAALAESAQPAVAAMAAGHLRASAAGAVPLLVSRARARGEWRPGIAPERLIATLVGAIIHRTMLEHAGLDRRWLESLVDLVLLGALPRDAGDR